MKARTAHNQTTERSSIVARDKQKASEMRARGSKVVELACLMHRELPAGPLGSADQPTHSAP